MNDGVFQVTGELTPELIREARSLIGSEIRTEGWNREASWDAIRHYAFGLGDDNPLFSDREYGARSPHRSMLAPPTFLYTICDGAICPGLPGIQPIYGAARWEWHRPVKLGELITSRTTLADVIEVGRGQNTAGMLVQRGDITYYDAAGEKVAHLISDTLRIPRATAAGGLSYQPRAEYRYSKAELDAIERDVLAEERRGSVPRYWEDVRTGEEVAPVVKGPINQFTMTAYYAGCVGSPGYKAAELAWKYRHLANTAPELLPNQYDPSYFAEYVSPSMGHQDSSVAREIGMPGRYNNGPQRVGWSAHMLTNWSGDHGQLRRLDLQLRRPELFGDTLWFRGVVTDKRVDEHRRGLVDVRLWSVNQSGEETSKGAATVELPRRPTR